VAPVVVGTGSRAREPCCGVRVRAGLDGTSCRVGRDLRIRSWGRPEGGGGLELGMAVPAVGAGARGCQTHWVRVWVSNRTRGCTHTHTHNKSGPGVDFHPWVTHGARKRANLHSYTY
jgi:hypothetical protein